MLKNPQQSFMYRRRAFNHAPIKVEFIRVIYSIPFLFVSGVFTGIAIMKIFN